MDSTNSNSKYLKGDLIDQRYKVISLLGQGGMAEVYLAEDLQMHNKKIALKLLFSHVAVDNTYSERFLREAEVMQKHSNQNIVRSFHYGKTERNEHYFTMEYVEGKSLASLISEHGRINYQKAFNYILQIAAGLDAAHKLGIIHRDIKPDNIILTSEGIIKITDFGIAKDLNTSIKLTELEKGPKSYAYKAPELYVKEYDQRVDIYSLGITAFELLTADLPFKGERHHLIVAHLSSEIPQINKFANKIPSWVQEFIEICCAKDPGKRFNSGREVIKYLKKYKAEIGPDDLNIFNQISDFSENQSVRRAIKVNRKLNNFINQTGWKYLISISISILAVILFYPWQHDKNTLIGDDLDLFLSDKYFAFRGKIKPPEDIVIVSIDEESYSKLDLSTLKPWPREVMAEGLEILAKNKVSKILLDFIYIDLIDNQKLQNQDLKLSNAIGLSPTYLAKSYKNNNFIQSPHELFLKNARGAFDANIINLDVVRNFNLELGKINGLMTLSEVLNDQSNIIVKEPTSFDMINYYGPPRTISSLPFFKLIRQDFSPEFFKGKIVLIGQHLSVGYQVRQADTLPIPLKAYMAGVEIHATCLGNLIQKNWIYRQSPILESCFIFYLSFLFTYLLISMTPLYGFIFLNLSLVIWVLTNYILFKHHIFIPLTLVFIFVNPVSFGVSAIASYLNKKKLETALGL